MDTSSVPNRDLYLPLEQFLLDEYFDIINIEKFYELVFFYPLIILAKETNDKCNLERKTEKLYLYVSIYHNSLYKCVVCIRIYNNILLQSIYIIYTLEGDSRNYWSKCIIYAENDCSDR